MIKILIVDDNEENLYYLQSIFNINQFETISAKNGKEALALALIEIPDLIISDILMPVMDGYSFCRECKKENKLKNIPFVFYTATYTTSKDEDFAMHLGAASFILKPQEPEKLLSIIFAILKEIKENPIVHINTTHLPEKIVLKEYNEILVKKLEDKMLQAEKEIKERKIIEASLRDSEERFRSFYNGAIFGLYRTTPDGEILLANRALLKMLGFSSLEELSKRNLDTIGFPNSHLRKEFIEQIELHNEVKDMESQWTCRDGRLIFVRESAKTIRNAEGKSLFYDGIVEDITERKQVEDALQESRQLFQTLAQVSPVGIFKTNSDGDTVYVNPRWSELSGLSFEEAKGYRWLNAVHPEDREKLTQNWNIDSANKSSSTAEYRFLKADGSVVWVMGYAVPEVVDNKILGYVGTITDVTELKLSEEKMIEAKEKAESANKLKDAFIANISHEIRTPLNGILGMSSIIRDTFHDNITKKDEELFEGIDYSSKRLIRTIDMILNYSRLQVGEFNVRPKKIMISQICEGLVKEFISAAKSKSLELSFENDCGTVEIFADEYSITMAISNLIDNAVKFTKKGSIKVILKKGPGDEIILYIKDTGIGIDQKYFDNLFEPYRQEQMGYGRAYEGIGLGLSIVKKVLNLNNSVINVESKKGYGTTFSINFGKLANHNDVKKESGGIVPIPPITKNSVKKTVLIVEDDSLNQMTIKRFLEKNYSSIVTNTSDNVTEILIKEKIDLILMDISINGRMNGLELTKELKSGRKFSHIPVIAITAHAFDKDKQNAKSFGCDDFLPKPFTKLDLLNKVNFYLNNSN
jgi:PAS domain S-box-containing protein